MKAFRSKTTGDISKGIICFILIVSFISCAGCQEKVKVVVNKPETEIKADKFTGM